MEKYLFTDGTNVVREAQSKEELQSLIQASADHGKVRIWLFNTSEWISLADFNKRSPEIIFPGKIVFPVVEIKAPPKPSGKFVIPGFLKKTLIGLIVATAIILVYNFTKVTWKKDSPLTIMAARPDNSPPVNIDSLIETIETLRGQKLDKITRTNLRIRNSWPDLLQLQLNADRDISSEGSRYYHLELFADNSTGYNIDYAVVKLEIWNNNKIGSSDTLRFTNIGYSTPAKRMIGGVYEGDSISVSFSSVKSRVFNFCYSSDKKSNYGNYNDRWFCKE